MSSLTFEDFFGSHRCGHGQTVQHTQCQGENPSAQAPVVFVGLHLGFLSPRLLFLLHFFFRPCPLPRTKVKVTFHLFVVPEEIGRITGIRTEGYMRKDDNSLSGRTGLAKSPERI